MHFILELAASFVIQVIQATGYGGIAFLMALESMNIPIPSEIIMPFAGFLAFDEKLNLIWVILWGTFGNLIGSLASYYLGFFGGRPFLARYGKFFLLKSSDVEFSEQFFKKYGNFAILLSRVLPLVRTFISFPAGIARMNIWKFSIYTLAGSFFWSIILAYGGFVAGANWKILESYFQKFDWLILTLVIILAIWWIGRHFLQSKNSKVQDSKQP